MALEAVFRDMYARLQALQEVLLDLRTTIVEDRPRRGDVIFVDMLSDITDELLGRIEEALQAARRGQQDIGGRADMGGVRQELTTCQELFNGMAHRFTSELMHYERMAELAQVGRERGGEWRAWADSVRQALEGCRQPLFEANEALFHCWQEIAERVGMTSVSAQATNIGRYVAGPEGRDAVEAAI